MPILIILFIGDLLLYAVIPVIVIFGKSSIQVNPRCYKCGVTSYYLKVCRKYGVELNVHIGKGMMHCWGAMDFVPEAKAVRQEYFQALQ
jgi:hypothetical protein